MEEELQPLDIDAEGYKRRREVADVFFYQYIKGEKNDQKAIEAIHELIFYGDSNLDKIIQKMALNM